MKRAERVRNCIFDIYSNIYIYILSMVECSLAIQICTNIYVRTLWIDNVILSFHA